ncbi:Uncharacterised protein [Acidipropionibacterium jensenii]|uniref:Uncharacterized protein n=1 Tax=Acidipropionibacterium jensenii TaxID=1749 RepID=A0A448NWT0_9ACTN|nr:Uncharacterised protein [Acidipropionibacterium jensenii]
MISWHQCDAAPGDGVLVISEPTCQRESTGCDGSSRIRIKSELFPALPISEVFSPGSSHVSSDHEG